MKKMYGQKAYVQSAGVKNDMEIDGFSIAVCHEIGVELSRHRSRSFDCTHKLVRRILSHKITKVEPFLIK